MTQFLISAAQSAAFASAIRSLGGKPFHQSSWIAYWDGSADTLCRHLRQTCDGPIIACALSGDWSYR